MGLSIHYNGKFNKNAILADLITEVKEIAEVFKWNYEVYHQEFPSNIEDESSYDGNIYGISFEPPECETIFICFLSNYRMSSYIHLELHGKSEHQTESHLLYMLSTKTQYAGSAVHKIIIELFRYLNKRDYFSELNLIDEGEYWETGDEKILEHRFKEYNDLIDNFSLAIETIPMEPGETYEGYLKRIAKRVDGNSSSSTIQTP